MRNLVKKIRKKASVLFAIAFAMMCMPQTALAVNQVTPAGGSTGTSTNSITAPLESLKTLVIAVIGAVGVIILAKNVMEFAQAYQQQDSSSMNSALKGIVAGVLMAGISTVLALLGF